MRTASILLAMVIVLGFAREAWAIGDIGVPVHDYTVHLAGKRFGLIEYNYDPLSQQQGKTTYTMLVGIRDKPFEVPFTATQGFTGLCLIVVAFIALLVVATFRWKRKRET